MKQIRLLVLAIAIVPHTAVGQTYPVPQLFDRTIDACIDSNLFPESQTKQCSQGAQQLIADTYCRHLSRPRAVTWDSAFTGAFQKSWKLTITKSIDGEDGKWMPFDKGGAIFTSITCENSLSSVTAKAQSPGQDGAIHIEVVVNNTISNNQSQSQGQSQEKQ